MRIRCGSNSDQGRVRTSNEDSYVADAKAGLFLVADGMGGHAAGEVASQIAAETVKEVIAMRRGSDLPGESLRLAVLEANWRVYEAQCQTEEFAGMGTTLTSLCIAGKMYYIAHVGDSRAYLLRNGVLDQLTRDHSLVWSLLEKGMLPKELLSSHPQKNLITRSVGPHAQVEAELRQGEALEGDVFLLCSDGLTDVLTDADICAILSNTRKTPQQLGQLLVDAANDEGGPDNITVVVVRLERGRAKKDERP